MAWTSDTIATLYFDLLGFGAQNSSVVIDDVELLGLDRAGHGACVDPAFDSGRPDDNVTNLSAVDIIGVTEPSLVVLLDSDGDGFDDGSTTADAFGLFRFQNLHARRRPQHVPRPVDQPAGHLGGCAGRDARHAESQRRA